MAEAEAPAPSRGSPSVAHPPPPPWPPGGLAPVCSETLTLAEVASVKSMKPRRRVKKRPIPADPPSINLEVPRLREAIPRRNTKRLKVTPTRAPHLFDWKAYNSYMRPHPICMLCEKEADDKHLDSWLHERWTRSAKDTEHAYQWGVRRLLTHENRWPEVRKRPLESWLTWKD